MDRYCLNSDLRARIRKNLEKFAVQKNRHDSLHRAAVAITVTNVFHDSFTTGLSLLGVEHSDAAVLITKRAVSLRRHAGQWALPGGRIDAGESTIEAALRELSEEVGISLTADRVLGTLDDYTTRSGFSITPVVVWGGEQASWQPNPHEVASIHKIPLTELSRQDSPMLDSSLSEKHPVLRIPIGNQWIAAPTAAILYQFREVALQGKSCRVSHYDQPVFAWS